MAAIHPIWEPFCKTVSSIIAVRITVMGRFLLACTQVSTGVLSARNPLNQTPWTIAMPFCRNFLLYCWYREIIELYSIRSHITFGASWLLLRCCFKYIQIIEYVLLRWWDMIRYSLISHKSLRILISAYVRACLRCCISISALSEWICCN